MKFLIPEITRLNLNSIQLSWEIIDNCIKALFEYYGELNEDQLDYLLGEISNQYIFLAKVSKGDYSN